MQLLWNQLIIMITQHDPKLGSPLYPCLVESIPCTNISNKNLNYIQQQRIDNSNTANITSSTTASNKNGHTKHISTSWVVLVDSGPQLVLGSFQWHSLLPSLHWVCTSSGSQCSLDALDSSGSPCCHGSWSCWGKRFAYPISHHSSWSEKISTN